MPTRVRFLCPIHTTREMNGPVQPTARARSRDNVRRRELDPSGWQRVAEFHRAFFGPFPLILYDFMLLVSAWPVWGLCFFLRFPVVLSLECFRPSDVPATPIDCQRCDANDDDWRLATRLNFRLLPSRCSALLSLHVGHVTLRISLQFERFYFRVCVEPYALSSDFWLARFLLTSARVSPPCWQSLITPSFSGQSLPNYLQPRFRGSRPPTKVLYSSASVEQ